LKLGRSKELIDKLDAAIESDPSNTIYYFARAISYEGTGELDKAAADYDKIIELDENYYDAYYNKGVMYLNKVSELVDEMNSKNLYSAKDIAPYEAKINDNYGKAIKLFEHVFENNDDMKPEDKMELARTMRKIYAQLDQMDKYAEMKAYIDAN
jgi:tetratricopeptide (TPR) repeat protein